MLLPDPGYPCNRHFLRLVEGSGELVPVGPESGFQLNGELVSSHWGEHTVGALVASPANPTGGVLDRDQLRGLSQAVRVRRGYLVVDEIYHGLGFGVQLANLCFTQRVQKDEGLDIIGSESWKLIANQIIYVLADSLARFENLIDCREVSRFRINDSWRRRADSRRCLATIA